MNSTYYFSLYDLVFESAVDCNLRYCPVSVPDVVITLTDKLPAITERLFQTSTYFGNKTEVHIYCWNGVEAVIRNGCEIFIRTIAVDERLVQIVLSSCIPLLMIQRGHIMFHASATKIADKALLFLGDTGAGKSTVTATLLEKGYPSLADDGALCSVKENAIDVLPVLSCIRLCPDSYGFMNRVPMPGINALDKVNFPRTLHTTEPVPLGAIIILGWGEGPATLKALSERESFFALLKHLQYPWLTQIVLEEAHMNFCASIAHRVKGYAYTREKAAALAQAGTFALDIPMA